MNYPVSMKRKVFATITLLALLSATTTTADAAGLIVNSKTTVISDILSVGQIWTGDIPVSVSYPSDSFSEKLEFPIIGMLPKDVLADRARGVEVEFAIWSDSGVKLGAQTVYSSSWNPVGPNTMVSMYLNSNSNLYGIHTMLITTSYTTSTTGLLSKYLKDEKKLQIEIKKLLASKAPDAPVLKSRWESGNNILEFAKVNSYPPVIKYQLTFASLLAPSLAPTSTFNYGAKKIILESIENNFVVTSSELSRYFVSGYATIGSPYILFQVQAVNAVGTSTASNGIYFEPKSWGLKPHSSKVVSTPTPTPKTTITCIKGKLVKKVTAVKPVCPAGYKKKT